MRISRFGVIVAVAPLAFSSFTFALDVNPDKILEPPRIYSPCVERSGDSDAYLAGVRREVL